MDEGLCLILLLLLPVSGSEQNISQEETSRCTEATTEEGIISLLLLVNEHGAQLKLNER